MWRCCLVWACALWSLLLCCKAYEIDPASISRTFDGIGGISGGGATSKLLISYADPYRSTVLDLLFKPAYGASLQILKVEIGGDDQTTDGTESSHMHEANDEDYTRGYEWWLMKEAKQRNPNIKLYALSWSFPGWVGNGQDPYAYPQRLANYTVKWILGAKRVHGLDIDYIGIWNERLSNLQYILALRQMLNDNALSSVKIIAPDDFVDSAKFTALTSNATVKQALYSVGIHYPGTILPAVALNDGIVLWSSEDYSTFNDDIGAGCWARILNQNFVNGNMTSYYDELPYKRNGLMTANSPWSGNFVVNNPIWITAHTTHFVNLGWQYLVQGSGSGKLDGGGSYVTLTDGTDFTIIIETMTHNHSICIRPALPPYNVQLQNASFQLLGQWASFSRTLNFFKTQLFFDGTTPNVVFQRQPPVQITNGRFMLTIPVDTIITLSTRDSAGIPDFGAIPAATQFPVPYRDTFKTGIMQWRFGIRHIAGYNESEEPKYLTPQKGVWEIHGGVARQMVVNKPIAWCSASARGPIAIIGNGSWVNYGVSTRVRLPTSQSADSAYVALRTDCIGCAVFELCRGVFFTFVRPSHVQLSTDIYGNRLIVEDTLSTPIVDGSWFNMSIAILGNQITYSINDYNRTIGDPHLPIMGFAGVGTREYGISEWDEINIFATI